MKKLSLFASLLLTSSLVYADTYIAYTDGDGRERKWSCMEMICPNGCVENNETGEGHCCSDGTSILNTGDQTNQALCRCPVENPKWNATTSQCVECITDEDCSRESVCNPNKTCSCATGTTSYTKSDGTNGCCNTSTHVFSDIAGTTNKACCPVENPKWDTATSQCVECLMDTDCGENGKCSSDKQCECRGGAQYTDDTECSCATAMVDVGFKNNQFEVNSNKITWTDKTKGSIYLCVWSYWDGNIVLNGANKQLNIPKLQF